MIKYNANPKGWKTGDCVIRAIELETKDKEEIKVVTNSLDTNQPIYISEDGGEDE